MMIAKMRTRRRKREAPGATLAEERVTREGEETDLALDAGEVRRQEQEQKGGRGGKTPPNLR
jgi:hypothetical protein